MEGFLNRLMKIKIEVGSLNHNASEEQKTKPNSRPFSRGIYTILQKRQPKDLQGTLEIGHKIFALGTDLKHMRMSWRVLSKLEELNELMSTIDQVEGEKLVWALKPAMLAFIQPKFLEEPCEGVTLPIAACLSNIMKLTAPIAPYNDDVMRRIMRLIVETFQDLDNSAGSTFGKKLEILWSMATIKTYVIMFDLECDDLIL